MSTVTKSTKGRKYTPTTQRERKVRLLAWIPELRAGVLRIVEEGKASPDFYHVCEIDADFGRGFCLEKMVNGNPTNCEAAYCICLRPVASTCECKGFLRHGHCRHAEALSALLKSGKL